MKNARLSLVVAATAIAGFLSAGYLGDAALAQEDQHTVIEVRNKTWVCDRPMNGETVRVVIEAGLPSKVTAVSLRDGCTGRFRLEGETWDSDGVKNGGGARDLEISGYMIAHACRGCSGAGLHQDVVQIMGGRGITFKDFYSIGREINHSGFFVNAGVSATDPPQNVVCDGCTILKLRGDGASAVHIGDEAGNGVRSSRVFCNQASCFYQGRGTLGGNTSPVFTEATWAAVVAEAKGSAPPPPTTTTEPQPTTTEPPPTTTAPPPADPFLEELQAVERIVHDGQGNKRKRIHAIADPVDAAGPCADKLERIAEIRFSVANMDVIVHERGACEIG